MRYFELFEAKEPPKGLAFRNEVRDYIKGQMNCTLQALVAGKYAGHIDYSVWQDDVSIQMIEVPKLKRKGIATALLKELQRMYPETEINWGMMTDDGSKLYDRTNFTTIVNPEIQAKIEKLDAIKAEMKQIESQWETWGELPDDQKEAVRSEMEGLSHRWNEMCDQEWDLEQELRDAKPVKKLISNHP